MPSAAPILTQGLVITVDGDVIGGVDSISDIGSGSATEIDTTTLASTSKEYVMGLRDNGQARLSLRRRDTTDDGQATLAAIQASQTNGAFVITLSDASTISFSAGVVSLSTNATIDDIMTGECVIRITGDVTYA